MADFGLGSNGTGRLEVWQNWNASTQVSYHVKLSAIISGGAYNFSGPNWNGNAGGVGGSGGWTYNGAGTYVLWEFDYTYNKDANGYGTWNFYGYIDGQNSPYVTAGSTNFNMSPTRIGIAPTISSTTADTITATSVRLGGEISSHGLGTSTTHRMYYRVSGEGSYVDAGAQGDVGGFNYWTITGLQPGKTYQYYMTSTNNNGDVATSSTKTFTTKAVPSMAAMLLGMV